MGPEVSYSEPVPGIYPTITLTDKQWDIVREALVRRGTKAAETCRARIWDQLVVQRARHYDGLCRCHPVLINDGEATP